MVMQDDHAVEYALARDAQSVRRARHIVSTALAEDDRPAVRDTALLLVSELVGNAVRYGEEPITMDLSRGDEELTVGVSDAGAQLPTMPPPAPSADLPTEDLVDVSPEEPVGGRGLRLIATLADAWAVEKRTRGKRVWFVLRTSGRR